MEDGIKFLKKAASVAFLALKIIWLTVWSLYQLALGAVLVALAWGVFKVGDYYRLWDIRKLRTGNPPVTAFIESERGRLTDSLRLAGTWPPPDTLIRWNWLVMDSIPKLVQEIALVAEDAKFFDHEGFDLEQIEYAMVANHQSGRKARGASTITQQVAKNLYLSKDKEMSRKLREAVITVLLENYLSKERILEIYLNVAQFDAGVFGIRAASLRHYRKEPWQLAQEEVVNLICLLPSPAKWSLRRPGQAFLLHKRLVMKNYGLFKGMRLKADSTATDWVGQVYTNLAEQLAEERWKGLRSRPPLDSSEADAPGDTPAAPYDVNRNRTF